MEFKLALGVRDEAKYFLTTFTTFTRTLISWRWVVNVTFL